MADLLDCQVEFDSGIVTLTLRSGDRQIICLTRIAPWAPDSLASYQHKLPLLDWSARSGELFHVKQDESGVTASPIPPKPSPYHHLDENWEWLADPKAAWVDVRTKRDGLLLRSDWTQLPDVPLATKQAWATYRQNLRDITEQPDPFNITWPTPPG